MTDRAEARLTRDLVEWMPDTRAKPERHTPEDREPTNPAIFLAVLAVMVIGLSLIASVS